VNIVNILKKNKKNNIKYFLNSKFYLTLVIIAVNCIFSGCRYAIPENQKSSLTEIKLAVLNVYSTGSIVAADRSTEIDPNVNCFAQAGLKPIITKRSKGPEVVDALLGGSAEVGTLAVTPQALQAVQGNQLVAFSTIQTTDKDIKVIGHKSAGIKSGSSLKGKRIGYVGGTYGEIFLSRYLAKYGLKKSDVSLVSSSPAQLRESFVSNSLDALVLWEPFIQDIFDNPATKKDNIFIDVDRKIYVGKINLLARPEFIQKKPKEAEKLVKALLCGEQLIQKYPDKARQSIEKWLDRKPNTLINVFDKSTFKVDLNKTELLSDLKEESKWALESVFSGKGKIPEDFNPFVNDSIMKSVSSERVQVK
jgi:ABC-type nitrate/sulfonate/bicarbonate transport system substrate-binding protein